MRLNKYLASCNLGSRRRVEELILAGKITVNGVVVTNLATQVTPQDRICYNGTPLQPATLQYIVLNKPRGYITTKKDQFARKAVNDLLPKELHLNPVGRLDADSTGVLLMTNDGELHYRLTHPRYGVVRTYRVTIAGRLSPQDISRIEEGIEIMPGKIARPVIIKTTTLPTRTTVEMELKEGMNREIRRLMSLLGKKVLALDRLAYGGIGYGRLRRGAWRYLTHREVAQLYRLVGLG